MDVSYISEGDYSVCYRNFPAPKIPRDILDPQPFAKGSLAGCQLIIGMVSVGNDTWVMIPTIDVVYDDGSRTTQTFD